VVVDGGSSESCEGKKSSRLAARNFYFRSRLVIHELGERSSELRHLGRLAEHPIHTRY
jgi:hypothetical protein